MVADSASPPELPPGLLEEYLQGMREQLGLLADLAARLAAAGNDREALDALRRETHKIHGSAGSYGFWGVSRLAAGMEATVKDWAARPDDVDADRGSVAHWFIGRLAEGLGLEAPAAGSDHRPRASPTQPPTPEAGAEGGGGRGGGTAVPDVILVEDDPALAELLEYGLRSRGYHFASFRNGRDALDHLLTFEIGRSHPLLLLDVDLPALDGYSIFAALQRERPGAYRVVFTTVHGDESEQLRGLEAGALDYLVKPISLRVALEKVRRWVGK
ncbi:MAG TPA: response regulator [Gemmatimonadales bacterium]|nr:response regulator [Gemmatimonadales bacterium]